MDQIKIGKFIAKCRKEKKLTQEELAEKLGVSDRTIGNWENGRNMPDLSLFKPLCEELSISINELISGEKIPQEKYQEKFEENIINTIDYTNKKINKSKNTISIILIVLGVLISFTAMCMFSSESSWGGVYSVLGGIISLIGISGFTKRLSYGLRLLLNFGYFIAFIALLFLVDYLGVINIHQAPRFTTETTTYHNTIHYDAPFYDVIRCETNSSFESYNVVKNANYTEDDLYDYCFNKKIDRFKKLIKEDAKNTTSITISKLVDYTEEGKSYTKSVDNFPHKIIKTITDKEEITEIVKLLNKANYPKNINLIGYPTLFQLYNEDELILEFTYNSLDTKDDGIYIGIDNETKNKLETYTH